MIIDGFQKVSLLDYPGLISCIIFTRGCNYNCSYCQNSLLINYNNSSGLVLEEEIITYLKKRKGIIEGIVISGGEPTLQKGLIDFIKKIKELDVKVKLDTNGSNPRLLQYLIEEKLIDYVAMDIKNDLDNYYKITCCHVNTNLIKESIDILKQNKIDYEFRTTIIKEYHKLENINKIISLIGESKYYLQNFVDSNYVRDKNLHGFSDEELLFIKQKLNNKNVFVRGIIDNNVEVKEDDLLCIR